MPRIQFTQSYSKVASHREIRVRLHHHCCCPRNLPPPLRTLPLPPAACVASAPPAPGSASAMQPLPPHHWQVTDKQKDNGEMFYLLLVLPTILLLLFCQLLIGFNNQTKEDVIYLKSWCVETVSSRYPPASPQCGTLSQGVGEACSQPQHQQVALPQIAHLLLLDADVTQLCQIQHNCRRERKKKLLIFCTLHNN